MSKERRQPPARIALEDIIQVAKETILRDGYHVPTLIIDGNRQAAIMQLNPLAETHEERRLNSTWPALISRLMVD